MQYDSTRYYLYEEMAAYMRGVAEARSDLVRVYSIGKSYQQRDLLLAEITRHDGTPPEERPGYWMDGNTHASELAGSAACLFAIDYLVRNYGNDPDVTHLLDTRTLYVLPRVSPDGAEYCLTTGDSVRSNNKPYPFEERWDGLRPLDIDGDGLLLQMRIPDPRGTWKVSEKDPRIMLRRAPDERDGNFFRIYREGVLEDWDGFRIDVRPSPYGMDFNRNYPYEWAPEADQKGAGPYPLSEPETRAVVQFIVDHPNICGVQTYHTYSAAILRPYSMKSDDDMPGLDLDVYKALGARGTEITGYPCISVYHEFRYGPKDFIRGGFDDWCFHHMGLYAFTTEIWSIGKAAGLEIKDHIKFLDGRSEDDLLQIFAWHDRENLEAFVPWRPFQHPQLGPIEIGGWKTLFSWSNPPARFLPEICESLTKFSLAHAAASPRLVLESFDAEVLSESPLLRKVTLRFANEGYLPTSVSETAKRRKIARPPRVTLEGAEIVLGKGDAEIEHLHGIANVVHAGWGDTTYFRGVTDGHRRQVEWLVRGAGPLTATVVCPRAGRLTATTD
ncbi:MAG: carboxypeptidase [Armatimonadetes bacterium]|nr:carboxypeptidase [Armatimonadota bacterium]